ncbi:hypothetical protein KGY58_00290 [Candidatus Bipolaricaulota bacterium]|nr:hypothetical protein [Candidatus Bipolaricaulota bacterium]
MRTNAKQIGKIVVSSREPGKVEKPNGEPVDRVLEIYLLVIERGEGGNQKKLELPEVRFLEDKSANAKKPRAYGPDRAKTWKMASEWIQDIVIDNHPTIKEKRYQNRVKAESSHLYNENTPDLYEWQEDEETLKEIRPSYTDVKNALEEHIGKPARSDFAELYPHNYDDPGLSQRARRTVRDLKAVFGTDILIKD